MRSKYILIFLILISLITNAQPGSWKQIGKPGDWKNSIKAVAGGGKIYSVERNGGLFETSEFTGNWNKIGKSEFGNTKFLFYAAGSLYSIEQSGSLFRINVDDGSWRVIGGIDKLHTIESSGSLYEVNVW